MTSEAKPDWNKLPEVFGYLLAKADLAMDALNHGETDKAKDHLNRGLEQASTALGIPRVSKP